MARHPALTPGSISRRVNRKIVRNGSGSLMRGITESFLRSVMSRVL